jgi:hypothetical protein
MALYKKIPKRVYTGLGPIDVKYVKNLETEVNGRREDAWGEADQSDRILRLNEDMLTNKSDIFQTRVFYHELGHFYAEEAGLTRSLTPETLEAVLDLIGTMFAADKMGFTETGKWPIDKSTRSD